MMRPPRSQHLRRHRHALRMVALALAIAVAAAAVAVPFVPGWPAITHRVDWPLAEAIQLGLPALLAVVSLLGAAADGIRLASIAIAVAALGTLWVAAISVYTLVTPSGGGVFLGGLFTLATGLGLATLVGLEAVASTLGLDGTGRLRSAVGW